MGRLSRSYPIAHFESFADGRGWNASLQDLQWTRSVYVLDEVVPLIEAAEQASKAGSWVAIALSYEAAPAFDRALEVRSSVGFPLAWVGVFSQSLPAEFASAPAFPFHISEWEPQTSRHHYESAIHSIKGYIESGDTYQVNFTFPLHGQVTGDSFSCFRALAESQRAAYSAYLDIGSHRILSLSPELFVERRGDRLITRPMKGTLPRGRWLEEDDRRAGQLMASAKDRAENVMIVDLLRSDLGKVAQIGSVEVPELFAVERLGRVLQMTSTVTAVQRPDLSIVELLRALFPCGSVTGAPKARTMSIIRELEESPRGIYTGTIGLLQPNGDAVFSVPIRTLTVESETGSATFGVGGGVTWESTSDGEYAECCLKASFLTQAWPQFNLLETMALKDGVYVLLDRHLARARSSASYFGFRWNKKRILSALDEIRSAHPSGDWLVRLIVERRGATDIQIRQLDQRRMPVQVKFAASPIDDRDSLVFHKTTARLRYDLELAQSQPCDDVILWNSRGEVTESTIANIVIFSDGRYWTPPREAGLLAGTLRDELIAKGKIFERTITKDELVAAESFTLINSVRGWMPADLVSTVSDLAPAQTCRGNNPDLLRDATSAPFKRTREPQNRA